MTYCGACGERAPHKRWTLHYSSYAVHRIRGILLRKRCGDSIVNLQEKIIKREPVYFLVAFVPTVS